MENSSIIPSNLDYQRWMWEAIKEARLARQHDDVPIGAVVVFENSIIGRGHNQVEMLKDPTAHAEMIAITAATNALGKKWLNEASLFVTVEPCSMCAGAMVLARLRRLVYGAMEARTGAHASLYNIPDDPRLNHRIEVVPGILKEECSALLAEFFEEVRRRN